jgi:myo-inositol-1(or 4)-monophosphatase
LAGQAESRQLCLITALEAAVEAGRYFKSRIHTELQVKTKSSPSDLVTDVDPACEKMIRQRIAQSFPTHAVLGEETTEPGAVASTRAASEVARVASLWVVDPLDGTTNFVHGLPLSVVSIAYVESGVGQLGVIYDPYRDEIFYGLRGHGAYLTSSTAAMDWAKAPAAELPGTSMQVSSVQELRRCIVATGIPTRSPTYQQTTQATVELLHKIKSIRALGAAALHLAYVASGRIDAFWEYDLNAWDLSAGALLVTEAGGCVSELGGGAYNLQVRNILASGQVDIGRQLDAILTKSDVQVGAMEP